MKTSLPSRNARSLTGRWAASGLHLRRVAAFHSGVSASRSAARSAPAKLGIRSASGSGKRATRRAVRSAQTRSEEHTSELQSLRHLVCRLLLEKKKKEKDKGPHCSQ